MGRLRLLVGINVFWLALSFLFDGLTNLVLPAHLLATADRTTSATQLGLITFAGLLAGMLIQPIAGRWSDRLRPRWGRRGPLTLGALAILASLALFGAAQGLWLTALAYLAIQLGASVAQAAEQGFIPDQVDSRRRGVASGLKGLMDLGGAMLGFALLGALLGGGDSRPALLAIAAAVLLAWALTVALVREGRQPALPARPALLQAYRFDLAANRPFAWLVAARWLFLLGTYGVGRFLLLYVADRLGLDPGRAAESAGALLAGLTLVAVAAAVPAGWLADRLGRPPLMVAGAALSGLGALLLIAAGDATAILLAGSLMGLGSAAFAGANWAMTADLAPREEAARFFALANFGTAGAAAAAGLFGPLVDVADRLSPGSGFPALFVACALAFAGSALAVRRINVPREEEAGRELRIRGLEEPG
jgi:MFS family permease